MFENAKFYKALRGKVIPFLRTYPSVRLWYVDCCDAGDLYSLLILLHEAGLAERARIYATQETESALKRMERGGVPRTSLGRYQRNYRRAGGSGDFRSYFSIRGHRAFIDEALTRNVSFFQYDPTMDGSFNEFHAILCRNVMRQIGPSHKGRVHRLILDSLCRFGVLSLGNRESMTGTGFEKNYEAIDVPTRLYKKIA